LQNTLRTTKIAPARSGPFLMALAVLLLLAGAVGVGAGGEVLWWAGQEIIAAPLRLVALAALSLVPGLALLRLLLPRDHPLPLAFVLALAAGVSVALPPLLLLLFHLLHLPWNGVTTWGYLVVSAAVALLPIRPAPAAPSTSSKSSVKKIPSFVLAPPWYLVHRDRSGDIVGVLLAAVTIAALLLRLFVVRHLPTGLFGDSYHHTMIVQLLVDNEGLFRSWQPYAPLATLTYHVGFHANAALFHWVSNMSVVRSVLWCGQVLNALSVPLAFALVFALGSRMSALAPSTPARQSPSPRQAGGENGFSQRAALWAALLTGFVSVLPSYYVNWGRYTQLTGHLVLVVVVVGWMSFARATWLHMGPENAQQAPSPRWKSYSLVVILTAAMILTHYLVTLFAAAFVGSYLLVAILVQRSWRFAWLLTIRATLAVLLVLVVCGPWLLNLFGSYLMPNAASFVQEVPAPDQIARASALPDMVPLYARGVVLVGALVGLCVANWRRLWRVAMPGLWSILLVVCVVPHIVGLPATGLIDSLTGFGAFYLTLPVLASFALATMQEGSEAGLRWLRIPPVVGLVLAGGGALAIITWGSHWQRNVVDPSTQLVTPADMRAMVWIRQHTPPDSRFYVNSFPAYGGTLVAGTDAGWWLPLLAGRPSNLPPLTYGTEWGEEPYYLDRVNLLVEAVRGHPLTSTDPVSVDLTRPEARQTLRKAGIEYVYIGAHASPGPTAADHIDADRLRNDPAFHLVYNSRGVKIFQFRAMSEQ
jgi:hypothetical protein